MSLIAALTGSVLLLQTLGADLARAEEDRLEACIAKIEVSAEEAYEDGLAWTHEGNRPGARQCTALALIALGNYDTGANRLTQLARSTDGGTMEQRAVYLSQAGHAWLQADAPETAVVAFTEALKLAPGTVDLLIDRAAANIVLEKWDEALADLDLVLSGLPDDVTSRQLRAEVHLNKKNLAAAKKDVDAALAADPKNIDTLLVRGRVREAIRIAEDDGELVVVSQ
ncbi:tetratricopeptide repeat protein [Hyphomonas sp.]|uniref:tetratricopeptide repeat protein n=1 Tax=Hyphomonas sp. TaxID=87 RepID=UPI00391ACB17